MRDGAVLGSGQKRERDGTCLAREPCPCTECSHHRQFRHTTTVCLLLCRSPMRLTHFTRMCITRAIAAGAQAPVRATLRTMRAEARHRDVLQQTPRRTRAASTNEQRVTMATQSSRSLPTTRLLQLHQPTLQRAVEVVAVTRTLVRLGAAARVLVVRIVTRADDTTMTVIVAVGGVRGAGSTGVNEDGVAGRLSLLSETRVPRPGRADQSVTRPSKTHPSDQVGSTLCTHSHHPTVHSLTPPLLCALTVPLTHARSLADCLPSGRLQVLPLLHHHHHHTHTHTHTHTYTHLCAPTPQSRAKALTESTHAHTRTRLHAGGAYIPPARLRAMQAELAADKSSEKYQRWFPAPFETLTFVLFVGLVSHPWPSALHRHSHKDHMH
jgi:hypothetical protein